MALSNLTRVRGAFDSARQLALTRTQQRQPRDPRQSTGKAIHLSQRMCHICILPWPAFIGLADGQRERERGREGRDGARERHLEFEPN